MQGVREITVPHFKGEHDFDARMDYIAARAILEVHDVIVTVANLED